MDQSLAVGRFMEIKKTVFVLLYLKDRLFHPAVHKINTMISTENVRVVSVMRINKQSVISEAK